MTRLRKWTRLPTHWIRKDLDKISWQSHGSSGTSAVMVLIAIAHHADDETGVTQLTYDSLQSITQLSRTKISQGLDVLEELGVLEFCHGQSRYGLTEYNPSEGWGKLPAAGLYSSGRIRAFSDFRLRKRVELDALKLYLLFVAMRDNRSNLANISYDRISEYSGVDRNHIKSALSLLAAQGLVHIEHVPSDQSEFGIANAYRLTHLDAYAHMGTTGRSLEAELF